MIRTLRIKFVAVNMCIVSLMLCLILGLVYGFTAKSLEQQSIRMMKGVAARPFALRLPNEPGEDVRLPFFSIRLGPKGEAIQMEGGYYDLRQNDELAALIDWALHSGLQVGVLPAYELRYCHVETPGGRYLVFADVSSERDTLDTLSRNLWIIGAAGFAGFMALSVLLSGWAVRPVQKTFQRQKRFIADASHELKTPLTVLIANAQMMEGFVYTHRAEPTPTHNILAMAYQMKDLVEQMLELARTESTEAKRPRGIVPISKDTETTALLYEPVFFEQGFMLHEQIESGIQAIGDRQELRHLLEILLDNARKYADPHSAVQVCLARKGHRRCVLQVQNQGQTLTREQLDRLFTRFYRADEARCSSGSYGLGLAIAQSIVKRHKGKIWFTSEAGSTICYVELPCTPLHKEPH